MITQRGRTFNPDNPIFDVVMPNSKEKPILQRIAHAYLMEPHDSLPRCTGLIPLSPNWSLSHSPKLGLALIPNLDFNLVQVKVISAEKQSRGTIKKSIATYPIRGYNCQQFYPREESQADRMGQVQTCKVVRDYYPIYRRNGPPIPGKSPLQFVVPPDALYFSAKEQWRYLKSLD